MAEPIGTEIDRVLAEGLAVVGTVAWLVEEEVPAALARKCCLAELGQFMEMGRTLEGAAADVAGMDGVYPWGIRSRARTS